MNREKILNFESFDSSLINSNKIVLCHGVFDILHYGHLLYLNNAKKYGDLLIVSVTSDEFVNKGPGRPMNSINKRIQMLSALEIVDFVIISKFETSKEIIEKIKPAFYVKGPDYKNFNNDITGNIKIELDALKNIGGKLIISDAETMSSSEIINSANLLESENFDYLNDFKKKHSIEFLYEIIDKIKNLKVLLIGETIIDEYVYCEALGKASKEPVLAFNIKSKNKYYGGIAAIAAHVAGLGAKVDVLSLFKSEKFFNELTNEFGFPNNVKFFPIYDKLNGEVKKTRYVDASTNRTVFETYVLEESNLIDSTKFNLLKIFHEIKKSYDLIIVCDYGHNLIDQEFASQISNSGVTTSINTQTNAGNRGFNTISKYPKSNFVCLNGGEVALEIRKRGISPSSMVKELQNLLDSDMALLTDGKNGIYLCEKNKSVLKSPAFSTQVVDRVGAGDAVLAISSLLYKVEASPEIIGLISNLIGGTYVKQLGNKLPINVVSLKKSLQHVL